MKLDSKIVLFVLFVIVFGVLLYAFTQRQSSKNINSGIKMNEVTDFQPPAEQNLENEVLTYLVEVDDQESGDGVVIKTVELKQPGFIVIHENDNGNPGKIIGNSDLIEDRDENIEIKLSRNSVAGEKLFAMAHVDDGNGVYEFPGPDVPAKDSTNKIVMTVFSITSVTTDGTPTMVR